MKKIIVLLSLSILSGITFAKDLDCEYVVEKIEGKNVISTHKPTLNFNKEEHKVYGNASCNRYFGNYTESNGKYDIGMIASTLMACYPNEVNEQEMIFTKTLPKVKSVSLSGDSAIFLDKDFNKLLETRKCQK